VPDRWRDYLVRVRLYVRQIGSRVQGEVLAPTNVSRVVHNFLVAQIDDAPVLFAYFELVKSSADRDGVYGLPEKRRETECF